MFNLEQMMTKTKISVNLIELHWNAFRSFVWIYVQYFPLRYLQHEEQETEQFSIEFSSIAENWNSALVVNEMYISIMQIKAFKCLFSQSFHQSSRNSLEKVTKISHGTH